jgi:hypothetical protein
LVIVLSLQLKQAESLAQFAELFLRHHANCSGRHFKRNHHVPKLKRDANLMEKVQRRFTKAIKGLHYLTYVERLRELQAQTSANRMMYSDIVFIRKCLHGKVNVAASDLGLFPRTSNTRGDGHRLIQRHTNNRTSHLFCFVLCFCGISYIFTLCLATLYLFSSIVYIAICF